MYSLSIRSKGLGLLHIDMRALYIRRDCFHAACQPPTYPTPSASSLREQRFVCILQQQRNMYHGDFTIVEPPYRESTVAIDIIFLFFLWDDEDHFLTHDAIGFLYFVLGSGSSESLLPSPSLFPKDPASLELVPVHECVQYLYAASDSSSC